MSCGAPELCGSLLILPFAQTPCDNPRALTLCSEAEPGELAEDALGDEVDVAGGKARVVPQVGSLCLGNVKVSCGLRDETPAVGWDEVGKLIQEPSVGQTCRGKKKEHAARVRILCPLQWD